MMAWRNSPGQLAVVIALAIGLGTPVASQLEAKSKPKAVCSKVERADADKWLWLNARDKKRSVAQNLPWGAPVEQSPDFSERELVQQEYVIGYDAELKVPVWSAERVVGSDIGKVGRSDCFRQDPRLKPAEASAPSDYVEPIFDQGHMTPSGDVTVSKRAVHNSFIMSNMSPQYCEFNRGIWQILEEQTRRWAHKFGTVYVLNGSIFDRDGDGRRDQDSAADHMQSNNHKARVAVPTAFYKILAVLHPDGTIETLTMLLPQDHTQHDDAEAMTHLEQHIATIAAIEQVTGLRFFADATAPPTELTHLWTFDRPSPGSLAGGCKTQ